MEVQGKIKLIGETKTFGSNGFRKRELVITTEDQYPQHILIEFIQDKVEDIDKFKVGQDVIVHFNLRGREWVNPQGEVKYFNSIQGWRIEIGNKTATPGIIDEMPSGNSSKPKMMEEDHDDLPF